MADPRTRQSTYVTAVLVAFGAYSVLLGLFMIALPGVFFNSLGAFGIRNDHYIADNAAFEFPMGLLLLGAARWPSWHVPALAYATMHWALHAISHIVDPHHADGTWVGWLEAAGLIIATAILAVALRISVPRRAVP